MIAANISILGAIMNLRIPDAVVRMPQAELDRLLGSLVAVQLGQIVLVIIVSVVVLSLFGLIGVYGLILVIALGLSDWIIFINKIYEREFEYRNIALIENGSSIAVNILAVIGAFFGLGGLVLFLRDLLRSVFQYGILVALRGMPKLKLTVPSYDALRTLHHNVSGIYIDGIAEQLYNRLTILLVGAIASEKAVGLFFQARRLAIVPYELMMPITSRMAYNYFSHKVQGVERRRQLGLLIGMELILLAVCAGVIVLWGQELILLFFNQRWLPVVGILYALLGFIVLQPLFETIKSFAMAENRLGRFIVLGRTFQFLALLFGYVGHKVLAMNPVHAIAYALSVGYLLSLIGLIGNYFLMPDLARALKRA